jgi:hypothetical protein
MFFAKIAFKDWPPKYNIIIFSQKGEFSFSKIVMFIFWKPLFADIGE